MTSDEQLSNRGILKINSNTSITTVLKQGTRRGFVMDEDEFDLPLHAHEDGNEAVSKPEMRERKL